MSFVGQLESPIHLSEDRLDDPHPKSTFSQAMGVHELPSLEDDQLVAELLTQTTFKSALGEYWMVGTNGVATVAPTTAADFHVVPAKYDAGFIEVDRNSCIRCHETVNQHVSRFQPVRDWYGHVRGSDGIFSFHPFDPSCLSAHGHELPVRMRKEFVAAGWVEEYDPDKHTAEVYNQISHLAE